MDKENPKRTNPGRAVLWLSVLLGVCSGLVDAFLDSRFFGDETFLEQVIHPSPEEIYMRGIIFIVFLGFGLVVSRIIAKLHRGEEAKRRIIEELTQARDEIKTLQGILPICPCCKKVRDDEGEWRSVETYVSERTNADFRHSMCPLCEAEFDRTQ